MAAVHVIAPHLFSKSKKLSSQRRLPLSPLNKSFMATTSNNSDPELSDDARSLENAQDNTNTSAQRSLIARIGKDGRGEDVLRRASVKMDASDTSSSWCAYH